MEAILDLNTGIFELRLYEGSTYTPSAPINFTDSRNSNGTMRFIDFSTSNNTDFFFPLPVHLLNNLKLALPPFTVSLPASLFEDGSGMTNSAQLNLPLMLIEDTTPPELNSSSLDLDSGQLNFTFSEPINTSSINLNMVHFTRRLEGREGSIEIDSATFINAQNFDTELFFLLSCYTLNQIKADTTLCTSQSNCLLNVNSSAFTDRSGNPVLTLPSNHIVDNLISDTTRPNLIMYSVDLDRGTMMLVFDEPVENATFNPLGMVLYPYTEQGSDSANGVSLGGADVINVTQEKTRMSLELETLTLDDLKKIVATNSNITFTIENITVDDTSGNQITSISLTSYFPPFGLVYDTTPPILLEFIAKPPDSQQLTFVFSEAVDITSWDVSVLTLLVTTQRTEEYTFSGEMIALDSSDSVIYTIDNDEYAPLMGLYREAYVSGSLAVKTNGTLISDLSGNNLQSIVQPLLFNVSQSDGSVELLAVNFDLDSGELNLTFSDLVVVTFPAGRVHFQNQAHTPIHVLTLASNGSYTSPVEDQESSVSFVLDVADLNRLKLNPFLATSVASSYVTLARTFASGIGSVPLALQNGTGATLFIPDTESPEIARFELDLDSDIFSIDFTEPIQVNSFKASCVTLINSTTIPDSAQVQLNGTFVLAQDNVTSFRALLLTDDVVHIKRQSLCYSIANCYAIFNASVVADVSGNSFSTILGPIQVDLVIPDVTPPQLVAFPVFDLEMGSFTLIFSEPVNGSSTNFAEVQFSDAPINSNNTITLTEGFTSPDHIQINFHISPNDLNVLKYHTSLCTNQDNCWIRLPSFFISDIGMNPFIHSGYLSSVASFHQPSSFIPDQTSPILNYVVIDLNQGTLTLSFSEVVVEATFSPSDLTLHYISSSLSRTLSAISTSTRSDLGTSIIVQLHKNDLNWLKLIPLQLRSIVISLHTRIVDVSGNAIQNTTQDESFQVNQTIPDTSGPQLVSFDRFNLENSSMLISFDEPVNVISLNITQVTLVSQPSLQTSTYTLSGGLPYAVGDSLLSVMIVLTNHDRMQIKLLPELAAMTNSTYITLSQYAIMDTSGNGNMPISIFEAIPLETGGYTPDESLASLIGFSLNISSSHLFLTFNDIVLADSINASKLTIQNSATSPTSSVKLGLQSRPLGENSNIITILLAQSDIFKLQSNLDLATGANNTYISTDSAFATDIEKRAVLAISNLNALKITSFYPDTTAPSLLHFSIDMDSGRLLLTFSEPILLSSVDPSQLLLHNQASQERSSLGLSNETNILTTAQTSLTLELEILQLDLNVIKNATNLAIDTGSTFLSFTSEFLTDTNFNAIVAVAPDAGIAASDFVLDTTPPKLISFEADVTSVAKIYLTFSETIRENGPLRNAIILQNAPVNPTVTVMLSETDEVTRTNLNQLEISLSTETVTRLLVDTIADSVEFLYLDLMEGVVEDTNGNTIASVAAYRVDKLCEYTITLTCDVCY